MAHGGARQGGPIAPCTPAAFHVERTHPAPRPRVLPTRAAWPAMMGRSAPCPALHRPAGLLPGWRPPDSHFTGSPATRPGDPGPAPANQTSRACGPHLTARGVAGVPRGTPAHNGPAGAINALSSSRGRPRRIRKTWSAPDSASRRASSTTRDLGPAMGSRPDRDRARGSAVCPGVDRKAGAPGWARTHGPRQVAVQPCATGQASGDGGRRGAFAGTDARQPTFHVEQHPARASAEDGAAGTCQLVPCRRRHAPPRPAEPARHAGSDRRPGEAVSGMRRSTRPEQTRSRWPVEPRRIGWRLRLPARSGSQMKGATATRACASAAPPGSTWNMAERAPHTWRLVRCIPSQPGEQPLWARSQTAARLPRPPRGTGPRRVPSPATPAASTPSTATARSRDARHGRGTGA